MPALTYNGCRTTGHSIYPPTTVIASQSKVFTQGQAVVIQGDHIIPHPHDGTCIASTSKVFVQGQPAIRIADKLSCDDNIAQGSSKVFIK